MIVTDATLLQSILDQQPRDFALVTAQRLKRYVTNEFDGSDASWKVADKLWRAAMLTRDAARTSEGRQS